MDPSLNRKISKRITPWLAWVGVTPNQVTLLSLLAGLLAGWDFLQGGAAHWIRGAAWFQAAYILDNCDGNLARLTGRTSGFGSWLDTVTDMLIHMAFFLGLGIGIWERDPRGPWLWLGILTAVGVFLAYLAGVLRQVKRRGAAAWAHPDPPAGTEDDDLWRRARVLMRGDFSFVVLASALAGQMAWLLWSGFAGALVFCVSDLVSMGGRCAASRAGGRADSLGG
ncbi:MAG: CDP-alcohol phosphatidyltransferase family protein [Candidatus Omnitrophica bacterium]|nr:CDP-alcohol phosphatidyltransferase family protein [Candidatus Omnitrophota bacterium]